MVLRLTMAAGGMLVMVQACGGGEGGMWEGVSVCVQCLLQLNPGLQETQNSNLIFSNISDVPRCRKGKVRLVIGLVTCMTAFRCHKRLDWSALLWTTERHQCGGPQGTPHCSSGKDGSGPTIGSCCSTYRTIWSFGNSRWDEKGWQGQTDRAI